MSNVPPPPDQGTPGAGWGSSPGGYPPPAQPPGGYQPAYGQTQTPTSPTGQPLAEWWKRLVAAIIDGLIVGVPLNIVGRIIGTTFSRSVEYDTTTNTFEETGGLFAGTSLLFLAVSIAVPILYAGLLNGSERGQTVGKMIFKIQVRDASAGGSIGPGRGLVRALIYQLLFAACVIPGIVNGLSPLWDKRRQAWHDKVANSLVVDAP